MRVLQLAPLGFGRLARAVGEHDDELVAGVAHAQVVGAQRALQRRRDLAQRVVADVVAVGVVDRLEPVDVHDDERHLALQALGARQLAREVHEHRAAVRQRRQRIGQRIFLRLLEDDRVVDDGAGLLGDALEQPAVILGVVVRLDVIERQAADEACRRHSSGQTIADLSEVVRLRPGRLEARRAGRR